MIFRSLKTEELIQKTCRLNRERVSGLDLEARSSAKGRTEDALASQDDEGRGKLR